jgi:hypothetical protein
MTSSAPAYEFFRIEGWGNLFIRIGDGLLTMACEDCRRPTADCLCLKKVRAEQEEQTKRKQEFIASLPRKMTKTEIEENEHTRCSARGLFGTGDSDYGWAGAWVRKDKTNPYSFTFSRYK